jgi:hypothetical protein
VKGNEAMSDYSRTPLDSLIANQQKGYVGLHIEQGVPVLDRDLNLLHDLLSATARSVFTRYIGNGIPAGADGFAIQALPSPQNSQNFGIASASGNPGTCLVGGIEVTIPADTTYNAQPGVPPLTTPTPAQPDPRTDIVYLDVSFSEVDGSVDPDLNNGVDVGMETSVRLKAVWVVRVSEGIPVPAAPVGHVYYPLAQLQRPRNVNTIDAPMITDLRQRRLTASDLERRLSLLEKLLLVPAFVSFPSPQFIPRSGVISQPITLFGNNFDVGSLQVLFGNVPAAIVDAPSPKQVVVKVPPGLTPAGTPAVVKLTVRNDGGSDISDDSFTVEPDPAFAAPGTQFSPIHGTPNTQVTINGFNFDAGGVQVLFGTIVGTPTGTPTADQIIVPVPTGVVTGGGTSSDVKITVRTIKGIAISDDTFKAEVTIPAPLFAVSPSPQFTPRSGVGNQTITLNGQNFNFPPVTVTFGSTNATVSGAPSATQIAVQVPPNMVTAGNTKVVNITVTTAGGSVVSTDNFTVTGP